MATSTTTTTLRMHFTTGDPDTDLNLSFSGVDKTKCTDAAVLSAMRNIVTNGSVYEDVPTNRKSAEIVETVKTPIEGF